MAAWSDMARRILKGAAPDSLDRTDEDGLVTKLFYPANADDQAAADHLLPAFPHQRLAGGWQVCQPLAEDATNTDVHEALSGGATALYRDGLDVAAGARDVRAAATIHK